MLEPSSLSWSIHIMKGTSVAAVAFLLWEWLIMLDDEVDCIWMRSNTKLIKCLYLFSRYFALVTQIISVLIILELSTRPDLSQKTCRAWISLRVSMLGCLFIALSMIIMIRVYALYSRSRRMGAFLTSLLAAKVALLVVHNLHVVTAIEFGQHCQVPKPPPIEEFYLLSITGVAVVDIIVIVMTMTKYVGIRGGWGKTPLGSLFVRDGIITYGVIITLAFALAGANLPNSSELFMSNNDLFHVLFSLFVPLISISACRLIINMQQLLAVHQDESTLGVSFEISTIDTETRLP